MKDRIFVEKGISQSPWSLPLWVPWKYKWPMGFALCLFSLYLYGWTNHHPVHQIQTLPLLALDQKIPFLPWTIWIYLSGIFFLPTVYFLNRCIVSLNKHIYSFISLNLMSTFIFLIYPIRYPRELFQLPTILVNINDWMIHLVRSIDEPINSFPSLHVSISFLIALGFLEDQKKHLPWILAWAVALSISTLTTKQHYVMDVLGGIFLAVFHFVLFHLVLKYRFPHKI